MQIVILLLFSFFASAAAVIGTQFLLENNRGKRTNFVLLFIGILVGLVSSVVTDFVIRGGRPSFYYHTHPLGRASIKIFAASVLCGGAFYALLLIFAEPKKHKKTLLRWMVRSLLIGLCGAVILEIVYFNFRHFELIGSGAPQVTFYPESTYAHGFYFNRASWKYHPFTWTNEKDAETFIYYKKVRNITYEFDDGTPRTLVRLGFNDSTHQEHVYIPEHEFIKGIPRSYTIPLHTVGVTYTTKLRLLDQNRIDDYTYSFSLPRVIINMTLPLELDPVRFAVSFFSLFLLSAFFPGSPLWKMKLDLRNLFQAGASAGLLLMVMVFMVWTVFSSYYGSDLPINKQKADLTENYRQYDMLVDALEVPRYVLLETPSHHLEKIDPYDFTAREKLGFDYPWDTAYYHGNYYVYFGVVPAVTVLLPYKLLTGKYLELDYPVFGFAAIFLIGFYCVYTRIVKRSFRDISFGLYWTGLLILFTCTNLTWCLRRTLVYELAIVSGICFAVWGVYFLLLAVDAGRWKAFCFFLSGTCTALAVGCRPTMLFVSLPVFTLGFFAIRTESGTGRLKNTLLFMLPYIAVGLALMKYNYERFDDPFEFGITYQLTTENRKSGLPLLGFSGRALSVLSALFTFPVMDLEFPFVHMQKPNLPYNGFILDSDMVLGVFSYPVMLFLFVLPWVRKELKSRDDFLMPFLTACLTAAGGICITSSAFAIFNRYLTDYLFLTALPAVATLFCVSKKLEASELQKVGEILALICAVCGVVLFSALSLTGEDQWFRQINPLYYDKLRYALSPWL